MKQAQFKALLHLADEVEKFLRCKYGLQVAFADYRRLEREAERKPVSLDADVFHIKLGARIYNALSGMRVETIGELTKCSRARLKANGLGDVSLEAFFLNLGCLVLLLMGL